MGKKVEPLTESYFYILLCLAEGPNHGYGIMQKTKELSGGEVKIGSGTMYGATSNMMKKGCHTKTYDAVKMFRQMDQARKACEVPSYMVPACPVCGGQMEMNLRSDHHFVQDEAWYEAQERFGDFLQKALNSGGKICLLELGTGFNTPMIIRFPFEKLVREHENVSLVRLNLNEAVIQKSLKNREVGINADLAEVIPDLVGI